MRKITSWANHGSIVSVEHVPADKRGRTKRPNRAKGERPVEYVHFDTRCFASFYAAHGQAIVGQLIEVDYAEDGTPYVVDA